MPTPRKSAAQIALSGAHDHEPRTRRADVTAAGEIGPWRVRSADPATVWADLVAEAPAGFLKAADRVAVELAVLLICEMRSDPAGFAASKCNQLTALLGKLGCLPAARLAMAVPEPKATDDPAEKYFAR